MFTKEELSLIIDSVRLRIATFKLVWSGRGNELPDCSEIPAVVGELEELLLKVEELLEKMED